MRPLSARLLRGWAHARCAQALGPLLRHPHVHTGLAKAEDKSRGSRAKKQEGPGPEDVRKKVPAPANAVSKEVPAPVAHSTQGGATVRWFPATQSGAECGPWAVCWRSGHLGAQDSPEALALPAGGAEEQWQRAIHERGEAVCPTCSVVTRKTLVGLRKHMEVCQKVSCPRASVGRCPEQLLMGHLSAAAGCPQVPALPEAVQVQGRSQLPHHG